MKRTILVARGLVASALLLSLATVGLVWAQDPVKVAPDIYKVRLENDRVRVLDTHVKPGGKSPTHSHPAHVVVALGPCNVKFTLPDGKTIDTQMKSGDVVWSDAAKHAAANVGTSDCHVLTVELKEPVGKGQ